MSWEQVRAIIEGAGVGAMATVSGDRPRVRPMSFVLVDNGRLWSSTYDVSGKVKELAANPQVELSFQGPGGAHVRVEGTMDISGGPDKKQRLLELNPKVKRHFSDGNDPKFVHLEVVPTRFRLKQRGFNEYQEVEPPTGK